MKKISKEKQVRLLLRGAGFVCMSGTALIVIGAFNVKKSLTIAGIITIIGAILLGISVIMGVKAEKKWSEYLSEWKEETWEIFEKEMRTRIALQRTNIQEDEFRRATMLRMELASMLGMKYLITEEEYKDIQLLFSPTLEELDESCKQTQERLENERRRLCNRVIEMSNLKLREREEAKKLIKTLDLAELKMFEEHFFKNPLIPKHDEG